MSRTKRSTLYQRYRFLEPFADVWSDTRGATGFRVVKGTMRAEAVRRLRAAGLLSPHTYHYDVTLCPDDCTGQQVERFRRALAAKKVGAVVND